MATERHISWNEEIQGIEVKTLFFSLSFKIILVNILWIIIVMVLFAFVAGSMFG